MKVSLRVSLVIQISHRWIIVLVVFLKSLFRK
jgi:hypothetical protein